MTKATIGIAAILLIAASASAADLEFKGIKIGQPFWSNDKFVCQEQKTALSDAVCHLQLNQTDSIAGQHADISIHLLDGKVAVIYIKFASDGYESVKSALTAKYGAGADRKEVLQNKMGATFENEITHWSEPDGTITMQRYAGSVDTGGVIMRSVDSLRSFRSRRLQQDKSNAADL